MDDFWTRDHMAYEPGESYDDRRSRLQAVRAEMEIRVRIEEVQCCGCPGERATGIFVYDPYCDLCLEDIGRW